MTLMYFKVKLKLKWTNYCVLAAAGADNTNANLNNRFFTITDTKLYVLVVTLSAKDNQQISKIVSKGLNDQCIGMSINQKVRIKIRQMSIDIFLNQIL